MKYDCSYTEYQLRKRSWLRQCVRDVYVNASLRLLQGRTIDFGCGTGELLQKLPPGSIGLEINHTTVEYCQRKGLDVYLYEPQQDQYRLSGFEAGTYESLMLSHVLEHLEHPEHVVRTLFQAARRLDIQRIVVIVPGKKGFAFDSTHRTYIDWTFFTNQNFTEIEGFRTMKHHYFPINIPLLENILTHFELQVVYDKMN
jgi:SAM-dependent methyltransferase